MSAAQRGLTEGAVDSDPLYCLRVAARAGESEHRVRLYSPQIRVFEALHPQMALITLTMVGLQTPNSNFCVGQKTFFFFFFFLPTAKPSLDRVA